MSALLWHFAGALVILAYAVCAVFYAIPAHGAELRCKAGEVKVTWYGEESCHPGRRCQTATQMPFNGKQMIVAHKTLPFGTRVRFAYRGRSIVLPVADRGPYIRGREYDLSEAAARALGTKAAGVACVVAKVL